MQKQQDPEQNPPQNLWRWFGIAIISLTVFSVLCATGLVIPLVFVIVVYATYCAITGHWPWKTKPKPDPSRISAFGNTRFPDDLVKQPAQTPVEVSKAPDNSSTTIRGQPEMPTEDWLYGPDGKG